MHKLTDADIVPNYSHAGAGMIDDGEELRCHRCLKRSTEPGTRSNVWNRVPNQQTHLPMSIELCDGCDHQVRQLQLNEPA
jgi:hypothetical protein